MQGFGFKASQAKPRLERHGGFEFRCEATSEFRIIASRVSGISSNSICMFTSYGWGLRLGGVRRALIPRLLKVHLAGSDCTSGAWGGKRSLDV